MQWIPDTVRGRKQKKPLKSIDFFQLTPTILPSVLFKMQDLVINGSKASAERLSSVVQPGDLLFSFCKPLVPAKMVGDRKATHTAVQVLY